jgi:aminoglycoside 6-adenylyltransferase
VSAALRRSDEALRALLLSVARAAPGVRAVILNGSRANPHAASDAFQDWDVVYVVDSLEPYLADPHWIDCFGERLIMQLPDAMGALADAPPPQQFAWLMLFRDGHRIDLTLVTCDALALLPREPHEQVLLDPDGLVPPAPPASPYAQPPTEAAYRDCCNEFWWVAPYVVKAVWRGQPTYAQTHLAIVRDQLLQLCDWWLVLTSAGARAAGKHGRDLGRWLPAPLWHAVCASYASADGAALWQALETLMAAFDALARDVAQRTGFAYPHDDATRVWQYVRQQRAAWERATSQP